MGLKKKFKKAGTRFRHELKFVIDINDAEVLYSEIMDYCNWDKHAGAFKSYEIASTYYDTDDLQFYIDREESVGFRRKIRLRSYVKECKSSGLFVEIKERHRNLITKKRVNLVDTSVLDMGIRHDRIPFDLVLDSMKDDAESRELRYLHKRLHMHPVVIIRYHRKALIPMFEEDMRITLDTRITAGADSLTEYNEKLEQCIIPPDLGVLEVKSNKSMPLWLQSALRRHEVPQTRYSKYCLGVDKVYGRGIRWLPSRDEGIVEPTAEDEAKAS